MVKPIRSSAFSHRLNPIFCHSQKNFSGHGTLLEKHLKIFIFKL